MIALQILGLALAQSGDYDGAATALRRVIAINPQSSSAQVNLGNVEKLRGKLKDAENAYRQALSISSHHPEALFNLGLVLKTQGKLDQALVLLSKAISAQPNYFDAIVQYGAILLAQGKVAGAIDEFHRALKLRDNSFEAHYNLGIALMRSDRWPEAKLSLARAAAINDHSHDAFLALGKALHRLQERGLATSALARAAALKPDSADAHHALAMVFLEDGWTKAAMDEIAKAVALDPTNASFYIAQGRILADLNRLEEAAEANNRAAALAPESLETLTALGRAQLTLGKMTEASETFARAMQLHGDDLQAHLNLARLGKFTPGDERLPKLESFLKSESSLTRDDRASLHFLLGKAYEDLGEYDRAFHHFEVANQVQRLSPSNSLEEDIDRLERTTQFYSREFFAGRPATGSQSSVPIFVLGMGRSGTTLVEQIVSSHPRVRAAGEVQDFDIATAIVMTRNDIRGSMPEAVAHMPDALLREIGDTYVQRLQERAPGAEHITDKNLGNYGRIGLIHLVLPRAKIIHCLRSPIDNCVSIYTNHFADNLGHASDLARLGQFYRRYHSLMAHWRDVLPGAFLDVRYEDTVADIETTARRIISYCDLEWDPRCLEFQKNERRVATLSVTQVRQSLYNSSVERWRNYQKHLSPLIESLGDLAPS